ncbi:MAG TPA: phosphoribosylformylglycinamidine synthase subunit PurS [Firmicutes bacterium]|nr:phosphoribosylformylglycinamidine synthase subunit PurS [Candidatus Fermentithermobacillaceae bacterium]
MRFRGTVTVALKEGIFDPQGEAVRSSLVSMGYNRVSRVRMGKDIVLTLEAKDSAEAHALLDDMARKLLANPVTEFYRVKVEEA